MASSIPLPTICSTSRVYKLPCHSARRYWLFAHHRLNKEVFEDRQREESRANGRDREDDDF
jgi:hypothetical protein